MAEIRQTELKALTQNFNRDVRSWGRGTTGKLATSAAANTAKSETLKENIRQRFRSENTPAGKRIFNVGFSFPLQGIWIHYGVGRGYQRQGGTVVRTAKSPTTNPRRPKDWFNSQIKQQMPALEQTVEQIFDNAVLNATNIYIKDGVTNK